MAEQLSRWERVRLALKGQDVDRPPVSMWRHFFAEEITSKGLAEAMLSYQRRFDWDFVKVNPRASYHCEGWGLRFEQQGDAPPRVVETPIREPEDWTRLDVLGLDRGVLKEHLDALEAVASGLKGEAPFLMTVFSPFSIASRLAPSEELFLEHFRTHPEKVEHALDVVTSTFISFSKRALELGASGLFYATTSWATTERWSEEEYLHHARPYDLKVLNALPEAEFHLLHVCRNNNMLGALKDYPVHAFNWDVRGEGNVSLAEGQEMLGGATVMGGLPHQQAMIEGSAQGLGAEVRGMRLALGDRGWMLGTGCTYPPEAPEANVRAIRHSAGAT